MTTVRKLKRTDILLAAALFFSVLLLYLPAVNFDADIFDDDLYTEKLCAQKIAQIDIADYVATPVLNLPSPLVKLSFVADRLLWGYKYFSKGLHFSNIFYHAVAVVLLYLLCRRTVVFLPAKTSPSSLRFRRFHLSPAWAAAAAAIWGWHPQRVESAAWISERKDVLLSILFFAALLTFIRAFRRRKPAVAAFVFFLLSLAVKPMLITLPAVLWVWMKIETGRFFTKRSILTLVPYGAVIAPLIGYYLLFGNIVRQDFSMGSPAFRATVAAWNIGNYFFSALLPVNLMPFYPFYDPSEDTLLAAAAFALLLIVLGISAARKNPTGELVFEVLLLFPIMLLPVCGFVRVGNCDWADRYNLLPSVFLLLPAVFLLRHLCITGKKRTLYVSSAVAVYMGFLCVQTILYLNVWKSYKTVLLASMDGVRHPNYRICFLVAVSAFCENDMQTAYAAASSVSPDMGAAPADKKLIEIFHRGMTGLFESLGGNADVGGKRLTELVLGPDADLMSCVSAGFLDLAVDASAYWNIQRNDTATAIKLYEICGKLSRIPMRREEMTAKAALLKKNTEDAEKAIEILEKKNHPAVAELKTRLASLKRESGGGKR